MNEFKMGTYIKKRREELKISQEELCEGLCAVSSLSRIENNQQDPSRRLTESLLERLGLPENKFTALWGQKDLAVGALVREISNGIILLRRMSAEDRPRMCEKLLTEMAELEKIAEPGDQTIRQFLLSSRATLGTPEGPYAPNEKLVMQMDAIRITQPRFDPEDFSRGRYSMDEARLINQIANSYTDVGDRKRAINIYRQLLRYTEKNYSELSEYGGYFCLVAHNFAICLVLERYYLEAAEIAEQGKKMCLKWGEYQFLPGFLSIQAESNYFLGDYGKSEKLYRVAYYTYEAYEDKRNQEIIRREMKEHLGIEMLEPELCN